jgi:hypothetical protein
MLASYLMAAIIVFAVVAIFVTKANNFTKSLQDKYPMAKIYFSLWDKKYLVVDFPNEKMVIGRRGVEQPSVDVEFSSIVSAEILQDGVQVAKTNRASQALGVAMGGVLLGGVGAIVGGLSASTTATSGTQRMSLRITVDDADEPIHEIVFFDIGGGKSLGRGDNLYDNLYRDITLFAAHIERAIRLTADTNPKNTLIEVGSRPSALSDQIRDLWQLKETGALTQEEFDSQKLRLMS